MSGAAALVEGAVGLQSLPEVYDRLTDVIAHPHTSAEDIADVVNSDPGLAARLLRLANSAFFGFPRKIETLSETVTVVGTEQLRDLALATSVVRIFGNVGADLVDMESYWRHSLACGIGARLIASRINEENVETFFLAGLLHDVGSLVLFARKPTEIAEVVSRTRERRSLLHEEEQSRFGFDHAEVGGELLRKWRLPEVLRESVAYHHEPLANAEYPRETSAVHAAEVIVGAMEIGACAESFVSPLSTGAWETLGLKPDSLDEIVAQIDAQLAEIVPVFLGGES